MEQKLRESLYIEHNDRIGVLCDNDKEKVAQLLGTDLTIVHDKLENKHFLLVPLTRNHSFKCKDDTLLVDGKKYYSNFFFRKDGCQWINIG